MKIWARRLAAAAALLYLGGLFALFALFRFAGERWWVTGVGLYVPRSAFLLPLPFTVAALLLFGPRRLLWSQLAAALFVVFPLMGFVASWPARRAGPTVRVLSFNVNSSYAGVDVVADAIAKWSPDIVLMQESLDNGEQLRARFAEQYPTVRLSTQFVVATRFSIDSATAPDVIPHEGRARSPRFVRYTMQTPLGEVAVYDVHPISPRMGMYALRGKKGLREELSTGSFFRAEHVANMQRDSTLRGLQVGAVAAMAAGERIPVIIGGDTNLPTLSPVLRELSPFVDGFSSSGFGFGYTYPARLPWMRIDRILTSRDLVFTRFAVGCQGASDHLCVVADLARR
jgi:endonuclease/exonuclease/phosphatase family metal-dependent hydrolase